MSPRSSVLQAVIGKLTTPHPVMLLIPIAIGAHLAAPTFAMGDTNPANLPAPIRNATNAVRPFLLGGKALDTDSTLNSAAGASTMRPAVIASPTVGIPGGAGSGGGVMFGSGMPSGSGGPISPRPAPPAPHDKFPSGGAPNLLPPARVTPPPVPHPIAPPVARIAPVTPPVIVVPPRPPIAHPPVIVVPPLRMQPFPLGRPVVAPPFMRGSGMGRRH